MHLVVIAKDGIFFSAKPPVSVKFRNFDGEPTIEVWNTSDSIIHDVTFSRVVDGEKRSVVVLDIVHPHLYQVLGGSSLANLQEKLGPIGPRSGFSVTCTDHSSPLEVDAAWEVDLSELDNGKVNRQVALTVPPWTAFSLCYCAPGSFTMGSPLTEVERDNDENQVEVTISRGFWIGQYEVTQNQWVAVMGKNPSLGQGGLLPVGGVSWEDASVFVKRLNGMLPNRSKWRFALPTEAQWEYACRAGTQTPFSFGSVLTGSAANCDGERPYGVIVSGTKGKGSRKVGSFNANPWGIYDMHGNVYEWCFDWYGERLIGGIDPIGPATGPMRMFRGGSWLSAASLCRSANRPDVAAFDAAQARVKAEPAIAAYSLEPWGLRLAVIER